MISITITALAILSATTSVLSTSPTLCDTTCPAISKPVCGSNGKTYDNECMLALDTCKDSSLTKTNDGPCGAIPPRPPCLANCNDDFVPVCGSDGKTYTNKCHLANAVCQNPDAKITKIRDGACSPPNPPCLANCSDDNAPVCGSDGKTYTNKCHLSNAICQNPSSNITLSHDGSCDTPNPPPAPCLANCNDDFVPVCGSDGKTYTNKCHLANAVCQNPNANITLSHDGSCSTTIVCEMACPATVSPVCGSNGITYNSECDLRNAACGITGLKVARQGACDGYTPTLTTTTAIKTAATTDGPVSTSKDGIIISGGSKIVGGVLTTAVMGIVGAFLL